MKTFGLPDVSVPVGIHVEEAAELINILNLYHIGENPTFHSGETFCLTPNSPIYQIKIINEYRYQQEEYFHNPYGLIHLEPISSSKSR